LGRGDSRPRSEPRHGTDQRRQAEKPDLETPFIFVGPVGYGFPRYAEEKFSVAFRHYWKELYGTPDKPGQ
jgi:hypothetical protein